MTFIAKMAKAIDVISAVASTKAWVLGSSRMAADSVKPDASR